MKKMAPLLFLLFSSIIVLCQTIEADVSSNSGYYHNSKEAEKIADPVDIGKNIIPLSLNINTKEKQIDVRNSYLIYLNKKQDDRKFDLDLNIGYAIGGKIDNSIASIFKNNDVVGGYKVGGVLGLRFQQSSKVFVKDEKFLNLFKQFDQALIGSKEEKEIKKQLVNYVSDNLHNGTYWAYISPEFEGRSFINIDSLSSTEFTKKNNTISKVTIGLSTYQNDLPLNLMGLFDLSLTLNNSDNFSELDEVNSYKQFNDSNGNSGNKQTFTSFAGIYSASVKSKSLSFETYLVSKSLPLFSLYFNPIYDFDNDLYSPTINLNYTIYFLSPKQSVLKPNFGLVFSHQDVSKNRDELFINNKSRFSIGLVTRLNIGNWFQ